MSFLTRLFGKSKKKINLEVTKVGEEKPDPKTEGAGTTLRKPEGPELTALEMAQRKDWEVKTLPIWEPGDVILDTYEVENVISGGMGHVYIANHNKWNVKLTIKSPNEMMLSDRDFFARILREANAWTELGLHPNIAYCYYVRNIEDVPHIVVEYVDGGNLRKWIEDGKCIDYRANLDLAIQFCHGMEHAHAKGMIHRDIKPENVLMTKDGFLKITDFGLVRGQEPEVRDQRSGVRNEEEDRKAVDHGLTTIGTLMGTKGYMAPEQAESAHDVDERADIFSFGVCLYEMFCGNKPYEITYGAQQDAPDPVRLSGDDQFPSDITSVLTKCVQWEPKSRYLSFKEIRQELSKIYKSLFDEESPYAEMELLDLEADGLNNRGVAYFELGRKEDAISYWEKAIEKNQTHIEAIYNQSLIRWRDGKIFDIEVINHLNNCENNPTTDKQKCAELKARIHAERLDMEAARDVLREFPGRYKVLFPDESLGRIISPHTIEGHAGGVCTLATTPDSKYAVSGGKDKALRMWELETGQCVHTMVEHTDIINTVRISSDGQYAVSSSRDKTVRMWKLETGRCLWITEGYTFALTPDSRYVITAKMDEEEGSLHMWELETGQRLRSMEGLADFSEDSITISPDSRYAVSAMYDKTLCLWELETGQCVHTMEGHTDRVNSVSFTPDGRYAVSGSYDNTLRMWDLETGKCVRTMERHTSSVNAVVITPDGRYAVSKSYDKFLRMWELETGRCVRSMEGDSVHITKFAITPDSRYVITAKEDGSLHMWELETGQCIRTMAGHTYSVSTVDITPDGRYAVSGGRVDADSTLRVWQINYERRYKSDLAVSLARGFSELMIEKDTLLKAIRRASVLYKKGDSKGSFFSLYKVWKDSGFADEPEVKALYIQLAKKGKIKSLLFSFQKKLIEGHNGGIHAVAITPDGRYIVSGSADRTLRLWEFETGRCVRIMEGHTSSVYSVAITPDGQYAVSSSADRTLRMWNLETGQCIRTMNGHMDRVYSVAITPNGRYAISGGQDRGLRVWELETGQNIHMMSGDSDIGALAVAITPDGRSAISGAGYLKEWEFESGQCIRTIKNKTSPIIYSLSISPNGRYAVSGSWGTIQLWELETWQCICTMEGHSSIVNTVAFTFDSLHAISGSNDKTLCLWALETGQCISTLSGHMDKVHSTAITPDCLYAVSGSADKTLRVWQLVWDLEFD